MTLQTYLPIQFSRFRILHPRRTASIPFTTQLFFCEARDPIRCNRCVSVEVGGGYCPNCLSEVPSANVRAEKNTGGLLGLGSVAPF